MVYQIVKDESELEMLMLPFLLTSRWLLGADASQESVPPAADHPASPTRIPDAPPGKGILDMQLEVSLTGWVCQGMDWGPLLQPWPGMAVTAGP